MCTIHPSNVPAPCVVCKLSFAGPLRVDWNTLRSNRTRLRYFIPVGTCVFGWTGTVMNVVYETINTDTCVLALTPAHVLHIRQGKHSGNADL